MSGRRACHSWILLPLLAVLTACDPGTVTVDASYPDAYSPPFSHLTGACVADWQCPGVGAVCRTAEHGYPGGECTNPCTDRTDCFDGRVHNECLMMTGASGMMCERYCRNGQDCRDGYTCEILSTDRSGATRGICIPACETDADCGGTAQCDHYTGRCVPQGMVATTGALTGEACTSAGACRSGSCHLPVENGNPTGFLGGTCESLCRLPVGFNTNNYFSGNALPQASCAGDAVCVPGGNDLGAGGLGVCRHVCTGNADCRAGYNCIQTRGGHTFTNGFCEPVNCVAAGMACPTGSMCYQVQDAQGNVSGVCG